MSILRDGSIPTIFEEALSDLFYDCTLTQTSSVGGNAWDPDSASTAKTSYTCKGMLDTFTDSEKQNSIVTATAVKILILQTTLSVTPTTDDKVTVDDQIYTIKSVEIDPANAVWVLIADA